MRTEEGSSKGWGQRASLGAHDGTEAKGGGRGDD